ncbi:MAG: polysaccharide pyruvyl transferase family protein, partial [Lachnospiraceae bacterium]|nr:polysaccharide pyruvyl transferase family protein [Lachnospiraceae bacterium]
VGYSVKARGIAKDLFETDDTSRYVIPVQGLKEEDELQKEFVRMFEHESEIREQLGKKIPDYIKLTEKYKGIINALMPE